MVKARRSRVSGVVLSGPLAPFRDAFRAELIARGYTPGSVVPQLHREELLDPTLVQLRGCQSLVLQPTTQPCRYRWQWSRPGLRCLLEVLREQGVAAAYAASPGSSTEVLLGSFARYLLQERGLATGTVCGYVAHARRFLTGLAGLAGLELTALTAGEVTAGVRWPRPAR